MKRRRWSKGKGRGDSDRKGGMGEGGKGDKGVKEIGKVNEEEEEVGGARRRA